MDTAAFKGVWVFCEQREGQIQTISYPVSYTHLDVYKRQSFSGAMNVLKGWRVANVF